MGSQAPGLKLQTLEVLPRRESPTTAAKAVSHFEM